MPTEPPRRHSRQDGRRRAPAVLHILILAFVVPVACAGSPDTPSAAGPARAGAPPAVPDLAEREGWAVLLEELEASFRFFWERANDDESSPGYGLIRDRYPGSPGIASIASVGFGLSALPVGVERGWVTEEAARARALGTLRTLAGMERTEGFFYHFVDMNTGRRAWNSEVSTIDTGLLLAGVLTAGAYFGSEVWDLADEIYRTVNWPWFVDAGRRQFHMAYRPEGGYGGHWDFYAEQLILYILAAGSPTYAPPGDGDGPTALELYRGFTRRRGRYFDFEPYIHGWFNSLFIHQYSHAWLDFRGRADAQGVDWFENSVAASRTHYEFVMDKPRGLATYDGVAWGLSASDSPDGYFGPYGAPPSGFDNSQHRHDGTIPPYAALGSIVFLPDESLAAAAHYRSFDELWGRYGFMSAYNLEEDWFSDDVIGIDKGITVLMIENAATGLIWDIFMGIPYVRRGLEAVGLTPEG